jgi:hypothetical protein
MCTYWDGQGHSAQEALSISEPFLRGGMYLVAAMWIGGPAALLGGADPGHDRRGLRRTGLPWEPSA